MQFKINISKAIEEIKKIKPKKILVQLPDGLKPESAKIVDELKKHTKAEIYIWAGTCYGSCDIPNLKDFDLLLHFGHTKWPF